MDSSGKAGLSADIEVIRHFGFEPVAVPAFYSTQAVEDEGTYPFPLSDLLALIDLKELAGVKLGALYSKDNLSSLSSFLQESEIPVVLDPVWKSSTGLLLCDNEELYLGGLRSLEISNLIVTPNKMEFELIKDFFGNVIITGANEGATDVLTSSYEITSQLLPGSGKRGTGCRYASALTCSLVAGKSLLESAIEAKRYVFSYLSGRNLPEDELHLNCL